MDKQKFCFIICSNNNLFLEESIHYINHLKVPEGYTMDLLVVNDASSITQGYNEALEATDAKYKIYMHQDVFILNKNLLFDLLEIFEADSQIGMIGMVGYTEVSQHGIMWRSECRGSIYGRASSSEISGYRYSLAEDGFSYVAEIDGFFMATCQDLRWDTERLKDWDFYDAFQSIEFLNHGYKIAVPVQRHPWCMHDDGKILNLKNYNHYRHIFMQTYEEYLGKHWSEIVHGGKGEV